MIEVSAVCDPDVPVLCWCNKYDEEQDWKKEHPQFKSDVNEDDDVNDITMPELKEFATTHLV